MSETSTATTPIRGTIILDATAIILLAVPINPQFIDPSNPSPPTIYLDILPFLAKNGYRILIPETVALVAGDILADGTNISKYFDNPKITKHPVTAQFLKSVARGDFPNIEIQTNTGPEKADAYCNALNEATRFRVSHDHTIEARAQNSASRQAIINAQVLYQKNLGDEAILSLLESLKPCGTDDLFIFINNTTLSKAIRNAGIQPVGNRTLFHTMVDAGLLGNIGLKSTLTGEDLFRDCYEQSPFPNPQFDPLSPDATRSFSEMFDRSPSRLTRSFTDLKHDLDAAEKAAPVKSAAPVEPTRRIGGMERWGPYGSYKPRTTLGDGDNTPPGSARR
jgi:hypothetical protein